MIVHIYDNRISDSAADANKYFTSVKQEQDALVPKKPFKKLDIMKQSETTSIPFTSYTEKVFDSLEKVTVKV